MIHLSAANLVKSSAAQCKYLLTSPKKVTARMQEGSSYQEYCTKQGSYIEMAETIDINDEIKLSYCIDEIRNYSKQRNSFTMMEHKYVENQKSLDVKNDWFARSCVVQTAFYYSLLIMNSGEFESARFLNLKKPRKVSLKGMQSKAVLNFGGNFYEIELLDPQSILSFYRRKAIAVAGSYFLCRDFDFTYARKEYDMLKSCFQINTLTHNLKALKAASDKFYADQERLRQNGRRASNIY